MSLQRIAKNTTVNPIILTDLGGLTISAFPGQYDLIAEGYDLEDLAVSVDLLSNINSGAIIINDGTRDLTPVESLQSITPASTEVTSAILDSLNTGMVSWSGSGNYYSIVTNSFILLRGGSGRIKGVQIDWAGNQSITLTANKTNYIYINFSGLIGKINHDIITENDFYNYIFLFEVLYDGTNYNVVREDHQYSMNTRISRFLHNSVGILIRGTGAIATRVATGTGASADDRRVKIVGDDILDDHGLETTISATNPITWNIYYKNASSQWIRYSQASPLPMFYNNAGTPTALGLGAYGRFGLYVSKDDLNSVNPSFIAIMGNATYATFDAVVKAIALGQVALTSDELYHLEIAQVGHGIVLNNASGGYIVDIILQKQTLPTKLLGSVQAVLPTLSQAYRALGQIGAGRIITVDQGAVELAAGTSGYAPIQLTPLASSPTLNLLAGQKFIDANGFEFCYNGARSKWLSISKFYPQWAADKGGPGGLDDEILLFGAIKDPSSGPRMFRNATIIGVTIKAGSGLATKQFELYKNGGPGVGTLIATFTLSGLVLTDNTLNIDLAAGDFLVAWVVAAGAGVSYIAMVLEIAWRA